MAEEDPAVTVASRSKVVDERVRANRERRNSIHRSRFSTKEKALLREVDTLLKLFQPSFLQKHGFTSIESVLISSKDFDRIEKVFRSPHVNWKSPGTRQLLIRLIKEAVFDPYAWKFGVQEKLLDLVRSVPAREMSPSLVEALLLSLERQKAIWDGYELTRNVESKYEIGILDLINPVDVVQMNAQVTRYRPHSFLRGTSAAFIWLRADTNSAKLEPLFRLADCEDKEVANAARSALQRIGLGSSAVAPVTAPAPVAVTRAYFEGGDLVILSQEDLEDLILIADGGRLKLEAIFTDERAPYAWRARVGESKQFSLTGKRSDRLYFEEYICPQLETWKTEAAVSLQGISIRPFGRGF